MNNHNTSRRKRKQFYLSQDQLKEAIELYQGGMSMTNVGFKYGVGRTTMTRVFTENNVKIRRKGSSNLNRQKLSDKNIQEASKLYLALHPIHEIAAKFGVSFSCMRKWLLRNGIKLRTKEEALKLNWLDPDYRSNQVEKAKERPSNTLGKKFLSRRGENHPWWKGGTELRRAIRTCSAMSRWRQSVFERDHYTCVLCESHNHSGNGKTVTLHADHIIRLADLLDKYRIRTLEEAENCSELWDIANGRTLCKSCHKQTPTFGTNWRKKT